MTDQVQVQMQNERGITVHSRIVPFDRIANVGIIKWGNDFYNYVPHNQAGDAMVAVFRITTVTTFEALHK